MDGPPMTIDQHDAHAETHYRKLKKGYACNCSSFCEGNLGIHAGEVEHRVRSAQCRDDWSFPRARV